MYSPGFNPAGLEMGVQLDPKQENQPARVTEPFISAMKQASLKNNPMNAVSQGPGVAEKVNDFLSRMRP